MRIFIMSSNEDTWEVNEDGWTQPIMTTTDGIACLKDRSKYTTKERKVTH